MGNQLQLEKIKDYLTRCNQLVLDVIYQAFAYLGLECVNRIRDRSAEDSWIDYSGNLRSSVGFIITVNGKRMAQGGFNATSAPKGNGAEGQKTGADYANSIVARYSSAPIVLIVVAGMEYALYVEAHDNKDVLASTELWAREEWQKRLPKLEKDIEDRCNKLAKQMGM